MLSWPYIPSSHHTILNARHHPVYSVTAILNKFQKVETEDEQGPQFSAESFTKLFGVINLRCVFILFI